MAKTQIPLKFKQIAIDNFPSIPDDSPIIALVSIAGTNQDVNLSAVKKALDWLETHGESLVLKDGVTPGKGLKRLKSCLVNAMTQPQTPAQKPTKPTHPKPVKKK
jgi:hypothetical protein